MKKRDEFLRTQKILRLATIGKDNAPHVVPVWYMYREKKFYIGANTKTQKVRNAGENRQVAFCIDVGVNAPRHLRSHGAGKCEPDSRKERGKKNCNRDSPGIL